MQLFLTVLIFLFNVPVVLLSASDLSDPNPNSFCCPKPSTKPTLSSYNDSLKAWLRTHSMGGQFLAQPGIDAVFPSDMAAWDKGANDPLDKYKTFYATQKLQAHGVGADMVAHLTSGGGGGASSAQLLAANAEAANLRGALQDVTAALTKGSPGSSQQGSPIAVSTVSSAELAKQAQEAAEKANEEKRRLDAENARLKKIIDDGKGAVAKTVEEIAAEKEAQASAVSALATDGRDTQANNIVKALDSAIKAVQLRTTSVAQFAEDKRVVESTITAFSKALSDCWEARGAVDKKAVNGTITEDEITRLYSGIVERSVEGIFRVSRRLSEGFANFNEAQKTLGKPEQSKEGWFLARFVKSSKISLVDEFFQGWVLDQLAEKAKTFLDTDPEELSLNACNKYKDFTTQLFTAGLIEEDEKGMALKKIAAVERFMNEKVTEKRKQMNIKCLAVKDRILPDLTVAIDSLQPLEVIKQYPVPLVLMRSPYEMLFYLRAFIKPGKVVNGKEVLDYLEGHLKYLSADQKRAFFAYLYPLTQDDADGAFKSVTLKVGKLDYVAGARKDLEFSANDLKILADIVYGIIKKIPDDEDRPGEKYLDSEQQNLAQKNALEWLKSQGAFLSGEIFERDISNVLLSEYLQTLSVLQKFGALKKADAEDLLLKAKLADGKSILPEDFQKAINTYVAFDERFGAKLRRIAFFQAKKSKVFRETTVKLFGKQIIDDIKTLNQLKSSGVDELENEEHSIRATADNPGKDRLSAKGKLEDIETLKNIRASYGVVERRIAQQMQNYLESLREGLDAEQVLLSTESQLVLNAMLKQVFVDADSDELREYISCFRSISGNVTRSETRFEESILSLNKLSRAMDYDAIVAKYAGSPLPKFVDNGFWNLLYEDERGRWCANLASIPEILGMQANGDRVTPDVTIRPKLQEFLRAADISLAELSKVVGAKFERVVPESAVIASFASPAAAIAPKKVSNVVAKPVISPIIRIHPIRLSNGKLPRLVGVFEGEDTRGGKYEDSGITDLQLKDAMYANSLALNKFHKGLSSSDDKTMFLMCSDLQQLDWMINKNRPYSSLQEAESVVAAQKAVATVAAATKVPVEKPLLPLAKGGPVGVPPPPRLGPDGKPMLGPVGALPPPPPPPGGKLPPPPPPGSVLPPPPTS